MNDLETERLRLERWAPRHRAMLARLSSLPLVMRHVGTGATWTAEQAAEHHERALAHWRDHHFGWRAARIVAEGERDEGASRLAGETGFGSAVGLIALNRAEGAAGLADDDFEIGWWLDPASWGRGYATEGARAVVDEAFSRLGAPSVVARVQPQNTASLRVAAALGLTPERDTIDRFGTPVRILRRMRDAGARPAAVARG